MMKPRNILLTITLALCMVFAFIPAFSTGVSAESDPVSYRVPIYNTDNLVTSGIKEWQNLSCTNYEVVENSTTAVNWGTARNETWYVVKGEITITGTVTCIGDVHLILTDGSSLTVTSSDANSAGICVSKYGNSFTVYGQSGNSGILDASCSATGDNGYANGAGIGGGCGGSGSNITINGGTVKASCISTVENGCARGAGIGGGYNDTGYLGVDNGSASDITINGGIVTASCTATVGDGVALGAGIGGGGNGSCSGITTNGGIVTASCTSSVFANGAGIGGGNLGSGSDITINDGTVTAYCMATVEPDATNGAGIGKGYGKSCSDIKISTDLMVICGTDATSAANNVNNNGDDMASALSGYNYVFATTPLTFTAREAGSTITFYWDSGSEVMVRASSDSVEMKDEDSLWENIDTDWRPCTKGASINLTNIGDYVQFKGTNVITNDENHFSMTGKIAASGDVTSLTNGVGGDVALTDSCYKFMFEGCTSLTTTPALPATVLAPNCYASMFFKCTSLTVPAMMNHVTNTAESCCRYMYKECSNLKIYNEPQSGYSMAWLATMQTTSPDDSDKNSPYWAYGMFDDCGGELSEFPVNGGTTYYIRDDSPGSGVGTVSGDSNMLTIVLIVVVIVAAVCMVVVVRNRKAKQQ